MSFVPANRLLWLVFYAALIGVGAGPFPVLVPVWLGLLAATVIVGIADAAWTANQSAALEISTPPVLRFMRDRAGTIPLTLRNPSRRARRIRVGLALPAGFVAERDEQWIDLPPDTEHARTTWSCRPSRRGRYSGVMAVIEHGSVLGLWRVRTRTPIAAELRVHPNLMSERKNIGALFLARGHSGVRVQRTLGRGREFEKLREYQPGDGFDEIHWKATAKRGRPVTKVFQAERTQEIYVVIDASRLSARPVTHDGNEQTALERYVTSALVLLLAAGRQGDKFGLIAYDDRVRVFVRAGIGSVHYGACREAVLGLSSSEVTPDIPEVFRSLKMRLRQRALLFFLTDLTDPVLAEDFGANLRVLSRQHLVLVGHLPAPGIAPLFSGAEIKESDEVYARLAGHARWAETRLLGQRLRSAGVTHLTLDSETMAAQLVSEYMRVKARQAL